MNTKSQSGSTHVVIIIILVIAIIGLLGFVLWQTLSSRDDKTDTVSSSATSGIVSEGAFNTGLSLKYPEGWTVEHSTSGNVDEIDSAVSDGTILTHKKGNVSVHLDVERNGQYSGGCLSPGPTVTDAYRSDLAGIDTTGFVSYITASDSDPKNYSFYAGTLTKDASIEVAACSGAGQFFELGDNVFARVFIQNSDIQASGEEVLFTRADVESFLDSEEYKEAKSIVESLYIK